MATIPFAPIREAALARLGEEPLQRRLPEVKDAKALAAVPDDRYLSQLSLRVFRAGLKHSLVDAKWPAFEEAFNGFVPAAVLAMSDEDLEALMSDRRLIRHWGKLRSVPKNAVSLDAISRAHGGFGRYLATYPRERMVDLWAELAKGFDQMGGDSVPRFLRMVGCDTFILSPSVLAVLKHWEVGDGEFKNKADRARIQAQFNEWVEETGLKLSHLSMILACSIDD